MPSNNAYAILTQRKWFTHSTQGKSGMTLNEAMAQYGPAWLSVWLPVLLVGAFVLPLALLIWKSTRMSAVYCIVASVLGGVGVNLLFSNMGYVKLIGLPHIIVWTPLAIYLWMKIKTPSIEKAARIVMSIILTTIVVSLVFDYWDVIRYLLGDRTAPT